MTGKARHSNEDLDEMRKDMDALGKALGIPPAGKKVTPGIKKSLDAPSAQPKRPAAKTRPKPQGAA